MHLVTPLPARYGQKRRARSHLAFNLFGSGSMGDEVGFEGVITFGCMHGSLESLPCPWPYSLTHMCMCIDLFVRRKIAGRYWLMVHRSS